MVSITARVGRGTSYFALSSCAVQALVLASVFFSGAVVAAESGDVDFAYECRNWLGKAEETFKPSFPTTAREFREHNALKIVVLGSSTTEGAGPDSNDGSYPAALAQELQDALPTYKVVVVNKGIGGQTAYDMLQRLDEDVLEERPTLLIWDTVVMDMLVNTGRDRLARVLRKGIEQAKAAGIDVALMDLPWFPRQERYPHYQQYRSMLLSLAQRMNVPIIPRYELMKAMALSGDFALPEFAGPDMLRLTEKHNQCLAVLISNGLLKNNH